MMKYFLRYDLETGKILSKGHMEERHIDDLNTRDGNYVKMDFPLEFDQKHYRVNLKTLLPELVPQPVNFEDYNDDIRRIIYEELARSDYTQMSDVAEGMTPEKKKSWKQYRTAIRNAQNQTTFEDIVKLLPDTNPKGQDLFSGYKELLQRKKLLDNLSANTI